MEILNIFYNNNYITFYLIGAILVVIFILILISSMSTTSKKDENVDKILDDPIENDNSNTQDEIKNFLINNESEKEIINENSKIDGIVEDLYNKVLTENVEVKNDEFITVFPEIPVTSNFIDVKEEVSVLEENNVLEVENKIVENTFEQQKNNSENIENMLNRLYELRQNENNDKKSALLNEIYDLKKQVDERLKNNYSLNYEYIDKKVLSDYYLFNEDIEFPKLK